MSGAQVSAPLPLSVVELLRDTGAASAAADGQVHIISVSAIREALAERWPRREDGISDFVQRSFGRTALADDMIVRLNEVDFILIQPSWPPVSALSRATQLMRETLSYFLGEVRPENIRVAVVDELFGDAVQARSVTAPEEAAAPRSEDSRHRDLTESVDGSPPWERFTVGAESSEPVTIKRPSGHDLEAVFFLEPVWNIANGAVASFLVQEAVFEANPAGGWGVPAWELFTPECHLALAQRRINYLEQTLQERGPALVAHLQISATCLRHSPTRARLLAALRRQIGGERRRHIVIELVDLPAGFPADALAELVPQVAPYARNVLARTTTSMFVRGLRGLVWDAANSTDDNMLSRDLQGFCRAARKLGLPTAAYGLSRRSQVLIARAAGVTHAAGTAVTDAFNGEAAPRRFQWEDFYTSCGFTAGAITSHTRPALPGVGLSPGHL